MREYKHSQTTIKHHVIKTLCKRANIEQAALCRLLGITPTQLARIKKDFVTNLSMNKLYKMASALGLSSIQLLYILERNKIFSEDVVIDSSSISISSLSSIRGGDK